MSSGSSSPDPEAEAGYRQPSPSAAGRVSEVTTAEEVWRRLEGATPYDWDYYLRPPPRRNDTGPRPRVRDMVREVELMTGAKAVDVAAAELLDMARYLTRSLPPPNLVHIGQLVFGTKFGAVPPPHLLSKDGSFNWGRRTPKALTNHHTWRVLGVVCVLVTLDLAARRTATPWVAAEKQQGLGQAVTVGLPLNDSSVRALANALAVLSTRQRSKYLDLSHWWDREWLQRGGMAEKEVEVLYAALTLNRSITDLRLPVFLKRAGPGGPWDLDVLHSRHLCRMLSANSTLQKLSLDVAYYTTHGHDEAYAAGGLRLGGELEGDDEDAIMDVEASPAAPRPAPASPASPQLVLPSSWSNSTLIKFEYSNRVVPHDDDDPVRVDGVLEIIAHLHALQDIALLLNSKSGNVKWLGPLFDSLRHLSLSWNLHDLQELTQKEVEALAAIIVSNTSLVKLRLSGAKYSAGQWSTTIFPALAHNRTLKELAVDDCAGVDSHNVCDAMLSMLQHNTTLDTIIFLGRHSITKERMQQYKRSCSATGTTGRPLHACPLCRSSLVALSCAATPWQENQLYVKPFASQPPPPCKVNKVQLHQCWTYRVGLLAVWLGLCQSYHHYSYQVLSPLRRRWRLQEHEALKSSCCRTRMTCKSMCGILPASGTIMLFTTLFFHPSIVLPSFFLSTARWCTLTTQPTRLANSTTKICANLRESVELG